MSLRTVTANLGCGGPHPSEREDVAARWIEVAATDGVDLMFLQEAPLTALETLGDRFVVVLPNSSVPSYRCKSVVAARHGRFVEVEQFDVPNAAYHGSYLTAARIGFDGLSPFIGVSVHASPARVAEADPEGWDQQTPTPRTSAPAGELWDSDYVLATLSSLVDAGHEVLTAGDFNEARGWDATDGKQWGTEYFARAERVGLLDATFRLWHEPERPTHKTLQVDHVLATPLIQQMITDASVVEPVPSGLDHAPIFFELDIGRSGDGDR